MNQALNIILRFPFLLALSILILNDHVWKFQFHNFLTGKLSDFAGIFLVGILGLILFPKFKKGILGLIGIGFIWWKSPYSQTAIDWYNTWAIISIERVVDYGDLIALVMLPVAYWYTQKSRESTSFGAIPPMFKNSLQILILGISVLAFMATSQARTIVPANQSYSFDYSLEELLQRINKIQAIHQDTVGSFLFNYYLSTHIENANEVYPSGVDSVYYYGVNYREVEHTYYDENNEAYTETVLAPERFDTIYLQEDSIHLNYQNYHWVERSHKAPTDCRWYSINMLITGNTRRSQIDVTAFWANYCKDEKKLEMVGDYFLKDFEWLLIDRLR